MENGIVPKEIWRKTGENSNIIVPYIDTYGNEDQSNTFKLVEMATEIELGRTFIDSLIKEHIAGNDITKKVCMAKAWVAEMANRVAYNCLQLHGGYGYMEEYPICRFVRDVRIHTIFAGTTEVMKSVVGKMLGL